MKTISRWVAQGALAATLVLTGASCVSLTGGNQQAATTGPMGVFSSVDKGDTWKVASLLPQPNADRQLTDVGVFSLVEDLTDPKAMYWASRGKGIFYTYDDATKWAQAAAPLNNGFIYSLAVHPKDRCTVYATNGSQLFKTEDCTRNWTPIYQIATSGQVIRTIALDPFAPNRVYIGQDSGELLLSEDSGASWRVVKRFDTQLQRMAFDPQKEGLVYMATRKSGLLRSRDGAATWDNVSDNMKDFPGALEYRRLYVYPGAPENVYWISKYGVLVSRNAGQDWEPINLVPAPGSVSIYAFAVNPKNNKEIYLTATAGSRSVFYRSIDGGQNWISRKLPTSQVPTTLRIQPDTGVLYMGFAAATTN